MTDFFITSTKNPIHVKLDESLKFKTKGKIALSKIAFYYSIPNVDVHNNVFKYKFASQEFQYVLPVGAYELVDIIKTLRDHVYSNIKVEFESFTISANAGTMKTYIEIFTQDFEIDFSVPNSIGSIFGFTKKIGFGKHESENIINIQDSTTILVKCNVVSGGYYNGKYSQYIYQFTPSVPNGYILTEEPSNLTYYDVLYDKISEICITLTDQDQKVLNTRDEKINIVLKIMSE
jgi:hypothetical protein